MSEYNSIQTSELEQRERALIDQIEKLKSQVLRATNQIENELRELDQIRTELKTREQSSNVSE